VVGFRDPETLPAQAPTGEHGTPRVVHGVIVMARRSAVTELRARPADREGIATTVHGEVADAVGPGEDLASVSPGNERDRCAREDVANPVDGELAPAAAHDHEHVDLVIRVLADPLPGSESDQVGVEISTVRQAPDRATITRDGVEVVLDQRPTADAVHGHGVDPTRRLAALTAIAARHGAIP
jgi:hypothetical protein